MAAPTTPTGVGSSQQTLSEYAGPYVTSMLGKAEALSEQPYQVYGGPMTAGESSLQSKVFQGLGNLSFPSNLGQSFVSPMGGQQPQTMPAYRGQMAMPQSVNRAPKTEADWNMFQQMAMFVPGTDMDAVKANFMSGGGKNLGGPEMGAYNPAGGMPMGGNQMQPQIDFSKPFIDPPQGGMPPQGGIAGLSLQPPQASQQPSNIAQQYMNPYLQSVLQPQLEELRRQSQINLQPSMAKLTQAGGYGGGRQAIMQSEADRNLLQAQNQAIGQGYSSAYDKGLQQFNTEQTQARGLADLIADQGTAQRGIEQQGISADYNEFLAQRDYPQKMLQFQQSMLQGLPISTTSNQPAQMSGIGNLSASVGGMAKIFDDLKKFNLG